MKDHTFDKRMKESARDFVSAVQPALEKKLGITVHPIEDLKVSELIRCLDQRGIDAFYFDKQGDIRGLASRMMYVSSVRRKPAFSFRYKLWDPVKQCWDDNREYARKLNAANSPNEFILFPKIHVESFKHKGSGLFEWSFAAQTKDIMNYINENLEDRDKIRIDTPNTGELRQVIYVDIEQFARSREVIKIDCLRGSRSELDKAV